MDINEQAVEALRESEELFRAVFEQAPVMLDAFDERGNLTLWNRQCEVILGYSFEEVSAHPDPMKLFYPDPEVRKVVEEHIALADGEFREYRVMTRRGEERIQEWANFRLPTGAIMAVGHDVTAQRAVEDRMRHSQKLDALSQLSGGIAHDFNNLLTVIMANAGLLRRRIAAGDDDPQRMATLVDAVIKAARRGADLARKLQAFSRREMLELEVVDLCRIVADFGPTLARLLPERIVVSIDMDSAPLNVRADHSSIEQMMLNLVTNARDAIVGHGTLRVVVKRRGEHAILAVEDSGEGMSQSVRERAFEPFFTTKARGQGTGLGLSMVHGLMNQHDGAVSIETSPGAGTTVELRFPIVRAPTSPEPDELTEAEADAAGDTVTVLIAEDDAAIREVAEVALRGAGYSVRSAENGTLALEMIEAGGIDLVLCDMVMPAMDGAELYRAARQRHDAPRFLFMSGHPEAVLDPDLTQFLLVKPWTEVELLRAIRRRLLGPSG